MWSFNVYFTKMFGFILCLVLVLFEAEAQLLENGFSVIRLRYSFENNESYTVWKDTPLKIVIENANARFIWCNSIYGNNKTGRYLQIVPATNLTTDIYSILNIKKVTAEMNTMWKCTVLTNYWEWSKPYNYKGQNYGVKDFCFQVHVKGLKQVNLEVNDHILDYNDLTIDQSDDFYGSATYTFIDGEEVELSCKKAPNIDSSDTLRLEYFNAKGNCLFKTNDIKPDNKTMLKFRSVMKSTNDEYYLDCIWASTNPYRENRYRVTFNVKKDYAKPPAIIMSVNGQNLTSPNENYTFRFVNGEILDVTCKINDKDYPIGSLYFNNDSNITHLEAQKEKKCISLKYVKPSHNQNQYFTCSIHNTEVENPNARLIFSSDIPDYEVRIRGLPRNNFLYQYTNGLRHWTIEYQYSMNEIINITCVSKIGFSSTPPQGRFKWEHKLNNKGTNETDTCSKVPKDSGIKAIKFSEPFTRKLEETHNGSKIKCIYYPDCAYNKRFNIAEIILRLKPKLISKEKMDEATRNSVLAKDQDPDAKPLEKDTVFDMLVPIAVTIGVIVAVITMVCLVLWRKRTKRANLIENNYDNFSNENDSPIPAFPSQWETNYDDSDYAKTYEEVRHENYSGATDDDKLYKLPYNRESNISENHYFEIDELFNTKPDGLAASWNSAQSSNHNKDLNTPIERSHNSNTAIYNNTIDSKLSGYDQLVHHSLPVNESNENYSSIQSKGKNKSVTFRDMSNDLGRRYYSEGNARQDSRKYEPRLKQNSASQYANTNQDITYMQPGDMPKKHNNGDMRKISNYESGDMLKKSNFENHFPENKKTVNPLDLEPELLDGDFEISCKNELYGKIN